METFATTYPELASQKAKTDTTDLTQVSTKSGKKVAWFCLTNPEHQWVKSIAERVRYPECPICMLVIKNGTIPGVNDVNTLHPELAKLYSDENAYDLKYYTPTSRALVLWKDTPGKVRILDKVKEQNQKQYGVTNYGRTRITTRETIAKTHPELSKKLVNPEHKNLTQGSNLKVPIKCDNQHIWETSIRNAIKTKVRCPYCTNKKVLAGYNDLATTHPELAQELVNKELGTRITHKDYTTETSWVCHKGHTWETKVTARVKGTNCPYCTNKKVLAGYNDLATKIPGIKEAWHSDNEKNPGQITAGSDTLITLKCDNNANHKIVTPAYVLKRTPKKTHFICSECPQSSGEAELGEWLETITKVERNTRKIISPLELDFYLSEEQIAIEYNGLYWHSEAAGKTKNYHHDKWEACKNKGLQLITIWEDDWNNKPDLIKKMLSKKLGHSTETTVYARQTVTNTVNPEQARTFLENNHIQGPVDGSIRVGLYNKNKPAELVALMVLSKHQNSLNLLRYATSKNIPGGFTKLLNYVIQQNPQVTRIETFSDNMVSNGKLYENNGFTRTTELEPDYSYIVKGKREHKFNYRKTTFKKNPDLKYEDGLTEKQLAQLNNLIRVWDAGKVKWVKIINR